MPYKISTHYKPAVWDLLLYKTEVWVAGKSSSSYSGPLVGICRQLSRWQWVAAIIPGPLTAGVGFNLRPEVLQLFCVLGRNLQQDFLSFTLAADVRFTFSDSTVPTLRSLPPPCCFHFHCCLATVLLVADWPHSPVSFTSAC
jgi:hypothetical protein